MRRNADRFLADFARLKFSPVLPRAFTEHGAIMAANVLNSAQAIQSSVFVKRHGLVGKWEEFADIFKHVKRCGNIAFLLDSAQEKSSVGGMSRKAGRKLEKLEQRTLKAERSVRGRTMFDGDQSM